MATAVQSPPNVENVEDEDDNSLADNRKKKLSLKLQKLKLRKSFNQQRAYASSGFNMGAVYEVKLRKLRKNNKALAKALADQKIETQHWYNEVISLRGELQESHERLLRSNDRNCEMLIEREVERRIKEIGEPLNTAISQAMENLLVVVENFSKVKQLANVRNNSARSSSSSSSSSFSFPRSSGSRAPLSSCSTSTSSPCRSVRPMVSGHVLQPALVSIQKLDDVWKARVKERIQAREEEIDMSTIGEQSVSLDNTNGSTSQEVTLNNTDPSSTEEPANNTLEESTHESVSPKSPNTSSRARRGKPVGNGSRMSTQSPVSVQNSSPTASVSPLSKSDDALELEEDPLEGPSWWYSDSEISRRGRGRPRGRGNGKKRGRPKSTARVSSPLGHPKRSSLDASSESEEEGLERKKSKIELSVENKSKVNNNTPPLPESPVQALDHSYLASPATMLTRLENLEAKVGRRSKTKSKGRSLRINETPADTLHKQQGNPSKKKDSCILSPTRSVTESHSRSPNVDPELRETRRSMFHPKVPPPPRFDDFLIRDTDLTCINELSMDMTEPISKILSQAAAELKLKEAKEMQKTVNNDKKFFKNQTSSQSQSANPGKTPFDLSLMDDTYMAIPPYESQKTVEKENMPPESDNDNVKDQENQKENGVNLRRVSIILKDVMKSPETQNSIEEAEEIKPISENNIKKGLSRNRKTFKFSVHTIMDDSEEEEEEEDSWSPVKQKKKKSDGSFQKRRKSSAVKKSTLLSPTKKQRKRKNKSESEIPFTAALGVMLNDEKVEEHGNIKVNKLECNSIAVNPIPDMALGDCYVKICRTSIRGVHKSLTPIDESCMLIDNHPLSMLYENIGKSPSPTKSKEENPVKLNSDLTDTVQIIEGTVEQSEALDIGKESQEVILDQVVPDQDVSGEITGNVEETSKNSKTSSVSMPTSHEGDSSFTEEPNTEAPRRRRGAAMKIKSFKEASLNSKMRQDRGKDSAGTKAKSDRKSGRKSAS